MLTLAIDIGNSRVKSGVFHNNKLISKGAYVNLPEQALTEIYHTYPEISHTIISSVAGDYQNIRSVAKNNSIVVDLTPELKLPVSINYNGTAGYDRIAVSAAVSVLNPGGNSLVVDCGTCFTYSIVLTGNLFIGGAITPGLDLRFKALNEYTANLPLLKYDNDFHHVTGTSTNESILSGVLNGSAAELSGMIDHYKKEYPELNVYLTGGFSSHFEKALKNGIFADPDLVLKGLNHILLLNA